jgi:hypothetical protein
MHSRAGPIKETIIQIKHGHYEAALWFVAQPDQQHSVSLLSPFMSSPAAGTKLEASSRDPTGISISALYKIFLEGALNVRQQL